MELLVVIVLIAIITSFALVSIGRDTRDLVQEEAARLQALMQLASDEAVMNSRELAVQFHKDGYRFLRLDVSGEHWRWTPLDGDAVFRPRCLEDPVHMQVALEGQGVELESMNCGGDAPAAGGQTQDQATADDKQDGQEDDTHYPRVFFLSSGEITPFEISLPINDQGDQFRLVGQMQGELRLFFPGEKDDKHG